MDLNKGPISEVTARFASKVQIQRPWHWTGIYGLSCGILLGSLVAYGINTAFSQAQIASGFWRLAFVIGGIFAFIAMLLRHWLEETPIFEEMRRRAAMSREPPLRMVLEVTGLQWLPP